MESTFVRSDEAAVGSIRCESWRTYTLGYQISILRVNRQIYREAWGIFHLENFWTIVCVNKAGFGKDMKDRGFPVAVADDLCRHIRFPVLKVTVTFPSLEGQKQSDALVISTVHLRQLMRALWTAKGASEMTVMIDVQPPLTKNSPSAGCLLQPFFKLRSVKRVIILGMSKRRYLDELTRAVTTTNGINQAFGELTVGLKCLQWYIKAQRWGHAIAQAEKHSILMTDCRLMYGSCLVGMVPGLDAHTALSRCRAASEITIAADMGMAEVTLHLRQYATTVRFANSALRRIPNLARFRPVTAVMPKVGVPPYHQLLPPESEAKCNMHLILARSHMGLQQADLAFGDIQKARELMPTSVAVASVSTAWQAKFGPFPRFLALAAS